MADGSLGFRDPQWKWNTRRKRGYILYIYLLCVRVYVCHPQVPTGQTDGRNIINGYLSAVKGFLGNNRCSGCMYIYTHTLLDFILPTNMLIKVMNNTFSACYN